MSDFTVYDLTESEAVLAQALAPLGIRLVYRNANNVAAGQTVGFSTSFDPTFCIRSGPQVSSPIHIAFAAATPTAVNELQAAARLAGGDNVEAVGRAVRR